MKKSNIVKGKPLNFNVGLQRWYARELEKLVESLVKEVYNEIKPLYKANKEQITFTTDDSISSQSRIRLNALRRKYEKKFGDKGAELARKMVAKTNRYSVSSFWAVLNDMVTPEDGNKPSFAMKGSAISPEKEEIIKALIFENVSLIKSVQSEYFTRITGTVSRSIQAGLGVTHIEEELLKYKNITKRRARNIALDQTRKAYNSISLRNMQDANIQEGEWLHSGGSQNPRTYHQTKWDGKSGLNGGQPNGLNGYIFRLDRGAPNESGKTPDYIFPGQEPNCHCRIRPIIRFDLR